MNVATQALIELEQTQKQLTITQAECAKLLLQKRELQNLVEILSRKKPLSEALMQVREFHEKFGVQVLNSPAIPGATTYSLRFRLIDEEFREFVSAWKAGSLVDIADSLADMIYVILGAALSFGIPIDKVFDEVHRTNMAKENGGTRCDGKIMKPEGWTPPNIAVILEEAKKA